MLTGLEQVEVRTVPDPELREPTDAIVAVSAAGLCGSDLHTYSGREVAATGVDFLAVGALTHSAPALDLGLDLSR